MVDARRIRNRNEAPSGIGPVVYWMQRDQRSQDNWALLYAQELAAARNVPLMVVFNLVSSFGKATYRHYDFMFKGLAEVESDLRAHNITFHLTQGNPDKTLPKFVKEFGVGEVVTDFNPLRFTDEWRTRVGKLLTVKLTEIDAHNIVPCFYASDKEEFAAYTFRPKIHRKLPEFLVPFPKLASCAYTKILPKPIAWEKLLAELHVDRSVLPVTWIVPGANAAHKNLKDFYAQRLEGYAQKRNDPNLDAQSNLSPYFHFGQLAPQRAALMVNAADAPREDRDAYLEELVVRRELADNYCFYNKNYDQISGAHAWAQTTIAEHVKDSREYTYSRNKLEKGETHDDLWNAMQTQLTATGKLHGWCRMYWAKKILEWTPDVQTAIDYALYLNDRYELDGNDPNGVVGVMWSIAGVHDRAWNTRPIFGKIRYMNYAGAKRKFDVAAYVEKFTADTPPLL